MKVTIKSNYDREDLVIENVSEIMPIGIGDLYLEVIAKGMEYLIKHDEISYYVVDKG